jgi:transposase InsO family protein
MFSRFRRNERQELLSQAGGEASEASQGRHESRQKLDAGCNLSAPSVSAEGGASPSVDGEGEATANADEARRQLPIDAPTDGSDAVMSVDAGPEAVTPNTGVDLLATAAEAHQVVDFNRAELSQATEMVSDRGVDEADAPEDLAATAAEPSVIKPTPETGKDVQPPEPAVGKSRAKGRRLAKPPETSRQVFTPQQRLLLLDTWRRSGLPAGDFGALVGISPTTLYKWKQRFEQSGPEGLQDQPRGQRRGSRLPDLTKRAILMLKQSHPEWGCQRISDMLTRGPALPASASAVARVLHEAGYESVDEPTRPHGERTRRFERAKPNQLWQTDLFTFVLKRQNRRLYLAAFLDDHSRFLVSYGLHASQSTALVLEALEAGIASYGPPEEILTDNGPQYVTWRGKSRFAKQLEKRGIHQIVARPKRPQTLGKIERFWGTLWREFLETAVFVDLADARSRIGLFIDYYNFQRVHQGIDGLTPADRFFGAAQEVLRTLKERVAANALELARHGQPKEPFYVTGQVEGQTFSVHAEGRRLILQRQDEPRQEIALTDSDEHGLGKETGQDGSPDSESSTEQLPEVLCPQGSPPAADGEPATADPPVPGQSALDQILPHEESDQDEQTPPAEGDAS